MIVGVKSAITLAYMLRFALARQTWLEWILGDTFSEEVRESDTLRDIIETIEKKREVDDRRSRKNQLKNRNVWQPILLWPYCTNKKFASLENGVILDDIAVEAMKMGEERGLGFLMNPMSIMIYKYDGHRAGAIAVYGGWRIEGNEEIESVLYKKYGIEKNGADDTVREHGWWRTFVVKDGKKGNVRYGISIRYLPGPK